MAYGDIVANVPSNPAILSLPSPFLASRLDYGFGLPPPRADAAAVADGDVLCEETVFLDDGPFFFEDEDCDDALGGDVELRSPVEEIALPSISKSIRGIVPSLTSDSLSSGKAPVHVCTSGTSFQNSPNPQCVAYAREAQSSRPVKPDLGSRPVDIVMPRTATSKVPEYCKDSQKELMSARESLLVEAWERKRDQKHHDQRSIEEEDTKPEQLGRSVSDCGKSPNCPSESIKTRPRIRSLTDDDFDELRGFIDLGFRFCEDCIPHLCDTLPALEVYCAITQTLQDSPCHVNIPGASGNLSPVSSSPSPSPTSSWKVASPGDHPQDVKARLRLWAQAVACNLRQSY